MSRIGKRVLSIPENVNVNVENNVVTVKGPKGELTLNLVKNIEVKVSEEGVAVTPLKDDKFTHAMHGTTNANIKNMIINGENVFLYILLNITTGTPVSIAFF